MRISKGAVSRIQRRARSAHLSFNIHDRDGAVERTKRLHHALSVYALHSDRLVTPLDEWLVREHNRYCRHIGAASKIYPMNGPRECARRVRQTQPSWARA